MRIAQKKIPRCCVWVWGEGRAAGTRQLALRESVWQAAESACFGQRVPGTHVSAVTGPK